jgi:hypothetical protein
MLNSVRIIEAKIRASGSSVPGVETLEKMALEIEANCWRFPEKKKSGASKDKYVRVPSKVSKKCNFCQRVGYLEIEYCTKLKRKIVALNFFHDQQMKDQQKDNLPCANVSKLLKRKDEKTKKLDVVCWVCNKSGYRAREVHFKLEKRRIQL